MKTPIALALAISLGGLWPAELAAKAAKADSETVLSLYHKLPKADWADQLGQVQLRRIFRKGNSWRYDCYDNGACKATIDVGRGYIGLYDGSGGHDYRLDAALFRRADGGAVLGVYLHYIDGELRIRRLRFYRLRAGQLADCTEQVWPTLEQFVLPGQRKQVETLRKQLADLLRKVTPLEVRLPHKGTRGRLHLLALEPYEVRSAVGQTTPAQSRAIAALKPLLTIHNEHFVWDRNAGRFLATR